MIEIVETTVIFQFIRLIIFFNTRLETAQTKTSISNEHFLMYFSQESFAIVNMND